MKLLSTGLLFLCVNYSWAQTGPGGVGDASTNVLWLSADNAVYSDAGVTPAANNNNVAQWNDRSGNGRNASHATAGERPNYQTGVLNGLPVIRFTAASGDRLLSTNVATGNTASVFAVASWSSLASSNPGIIHAAPAGLAFSGTTNDKVIGMWVSNTGSNMVWGRGVQSNNSQRDIPQTTGTTVNTFYSFANVYDGSNITQYVNNTGAGSVTYDGTLKSWSDFGIGRQAAESWNGDIAEVIAYNQSVNSAQRIIINNYLAAKYNLSLSSNDVYTMDNAGSGNFDYEVAGIGRVNSGNIHDEAQGSGIVRILNPAAMGDNEFLMWGHNNGTLQPTNTSDIPAAVTARFNRVWRVSEVGDVGAIDIQFDLTGITDFSSLSTCDAALSLRLLVDTDGDGAFADESLIYGATNVGGNLYRFSNVAALGNGMRFTLAVYSSANTGPGGVGNVTMWWRANAGVTSASGLISQWADQSGNGNNLNASGAARPTITTSPAMNSQSVVRYSGAQYFTSSFSGPGVDGLTMLMAANGSNYQSLFRFQNTSGDFVVYPWGLGGNTFISSTDGGTPTGILSGLVNNVNNVGGARYQRNTANGMRTYLNGGVNAQRNSVNSALPSQPFFSGIYNPGTSEFPSCDVGEMIVYYSPLNDAQMIIVQNYLAAKFNVTLSSNDSYRGDNAANGNFDFDVAGIGRVNGSNLHRDSRGTGMVRIYNPTDLGDNEFLMWGHDNGSLATVNKIDVSANTEARLVRVWRVSELSPAGTAVNVGNTDIQFDLSSLVQPITASDLRLLIDHDGNGIFNEAGTLEIGGAIALSCDNYLFTGVPGASLTNGVRFTIGTINSAQTPLPITIESFSGKVEDGEAYLKWTTVSELNNDFFTVERSSNGKNFFAVGDNIKGAGTTQARQHYEVVDPFVPYGKIYYRLKQTDFDGQFSYTPVIMLENKPTELKLEAVPNPLAQGHELKLRVTSSERIDFASAHITAFDMAGKSIDITTTADESGQIVLNFNHGQATGVYVVFLRSPQLQTPLFTRVCVTR